MARSAAAVMAIAGLGACTIGGVNALPPHDAGPRPPSDAMWADAGPNDAGCTPGTDSDGDSLDDCDDVDPDMWNGMHASIGERPEWTGSCGALDDFAEMQGRFASPSAEQKIWAGWEFVTDADAYSDPSYGFMPPWPNPAPAERFSVRYRAALLLQESGTYCFTIDVGATGTGIVAGKNMCAQLYLDNGPGWLAETGFEAESIGAARACRELPAGAHDFDIVYWYFDIFRQSQLRVRYCFGGDADCDPDQPITADRLRAP